MLDELYKKMRRLAFPGEDRSGMIAVNRSEVAVPGLKRKLLVLPGVFLPRGGQSLRRSTP